LAKAVRAAGGLGAMVERPSPFFVWNRESLLDGFIATLDDSLDGLFPLGELESTSYPTFIADVGALAMGSATYEWMLRKAVGPNAREPQPWPYTRRHQRGSGISRRRQIPRIVPRFRVGCRGTGACAPFLGLSQMS
jgi:hypothetical protein